jgi:hypothetical protein
VCDLCTVTTGRRPKRNDCLGRREARAEAGQGKHEQHPHDPGEHGHDEEPHQPDAGDLETHNVSHVTSEGAARQERSSGRSVVSQTVVRVAESPRSDSQVECGYDLARIAQ